MQRLIEEAWTEAKNAGTVGVIIGPRGIEVNFRPWNKGNPRSHPKSRLLKVFPRDQEKEAEDFAKQWAKDNNVNY